MIKHSSGRYFWFGNITPTNPNGNGPRYPFVIGEVDKSSLLLKKDGLLTVDDRMEGESERMSLSNFMAHEDRETGEIVLHMSRGFVNGITDWANNAYIYRIEI